MGLPINVPLRVESNLDELAVCMVLKHMRVASDLDELAVCMVMNPMRVTSDLDELTVCMVGMGTRRHDRMPTRRHMRLGYLLSGNQRRI